MKFIALWIAFNAAYAREIDGRAKENISLNEFLLRICTFDEEQLIYHLVWQKFPQSSRLFFAIKNHYKEAIKKAREIQTRANSIA